MAVPKKKKPVARSKKVMDRSDANFKKEKVVKKKHTKAIAEGKTAKARRLGKKRLRLQGREQRQQSKSIDLGIKGK